MWIGTFGHGHMHPVTGEPLVGRFVRLPCGYQDARRAMIALFGVRWSHLYESEEEAGVERFNMSPLHIGDLVRRCFEQGRAVWPLVSLEAKDFPVWAELAAGWCDAHDPQLAHAGRIITDLLGQIDMYRDERFSRATLHAKRSADPVTPETLHVKTGRDVNRKARGLRSPGDLVHLLRGGFAVCRFSGKLPGDWPEGNTWAPDVEEVNCSRCLRAWDHITLKSGQNDPFTGA